MSALHEEYHLFTKDQLSDCQLSTGELILQRWNSLLDTDLPENIYQTFLEEYAGLFFGSEYPTFQVVAKFKLGTEYISDFLIIKDGFSNGTLYEFIEIEKPTSLLYTKAGIPSNDFNTALQQVKNWRRFLADNRDYLAKYLPSTTTRLIRDSNISFKVIIGRRKYFSVSDLQKRTEEALHSKIEIRSYDSLSANLKRSDCMTSSLKETFMDCKLELWRSRYSMHPLSTALSFSQWTDACTKQFPSFHLFERAARVFDQKEQLNDLYRKLAERAESQH